APTGGGDRSANSRLNAELQLYAHVRPIRSFSGVATPFHDVDLSIIRESSEGGDAAVERNLDFDGDVVQSVSTTTRAAARRIVTYAFDYVVRTQRRVVTLVHSANSFRLSSALYLEAGREVAKQYGSVELEEMSVDTAAM